MAGQAIPPGGLSLHGAPNTSMKSSNSSVIARSAVLLKVNKEVIKDLQQCSKNGKTLRLLSGKSPRLQYGTRTIGLHVSPEAHRNELYTSSDNSPDLSFRAIVTQQASIIASSKTEENTSASDAALANLKQSLASHDQNRKANQVTVTPGLVTSVKGTRGLHPRPSSARPSSASSPTPYPTGTSATPQLGPASTLSAQSQDTVKTRAMSRALLHLLAVKPLSEKELCQKTTIAPAECGKVLSRVAQILPGAPGWSLKEKSYKELDVWAFKYRTDQDRQQAITHAVRAFDRLRLAKEDKLWQMLLPEHERGKGKILSRLHSNAAAQVNKEKAITTASQSPLPPLDASDNTDVDLKTGQKATSGSTPRMGATMSIEKRMKEAKKLRVAEEAKEKKKQAKEAAAVSDREAKPRPKAGAQARNPANNKIKSAETVHSSDDDDDDSTQGKDSVTARSSVKSLKPLPLPAEGQAARRPPSKAAAGAAGTRANDPTVKQIRPLTTEAKAGATPIRKSENGVLLKQSQATGKSKTSTPSQTPTNRSEKQQSAVSGTSKSQLSPRKMDSKPRVPSPLGPTRPRNASSVSERSVDAPSIRENRSPAPTMKMNRPTNGIARTAGTPLSTQTSQPTVTIKKRLREDLNGDDERPRKVSKPAPTGGAATANSNSNKQSSVASRTTAGSVNSDSSLKRKANDISSGIHDHDIDHTAKHRRTESSSTQSAKYSSGSSVSGSQTTTARTSIASPSMGGRSPVWQRSPSGTSSSSDGMKLSWERALEEAERFRTQYYPAYMELYDRLEALPPGDVKAEDRKKLYEMHDRLAQMKKEIVFASR